MDQQVLEKTETVSDRICRLMPTLESPEQCRAYAGFLLADNLPEKAAGYFQRAAAIYASQGLVLEVLAVNLAMWQFRSPQPNEITNIYQELQEIQNENYPLIEFLSQLAEHQLAELISHMSAEKLPAGHILVKPGQFYDHFYMVASGTLKDSLFVSVEDTQASYRSPNIEIEANEYFGEPYPFDKEISSHSYIETLSAVELIKISKKDLRKLCAQFSQFEVGLLKLLKIRKRSENLDPERLRRTKRLKLGVELNMMIDLVSDQGRPIQLQGYTQDISVDGICAVLENDSCADLQTHHTPDKIVGETIKIAAGLNYLKVFFSGKIAWWKYVSDGGPKTIALGIQLNMLPPSYKGILMSFLSLNRAEDSSSEP